MTEQKVVLITGAAGGLGQAMIAAFAKGDWKIVATSRSHLAPMSGVHGILMDVARTADVERGFAEALDQFGKLDVLINNAGLTMDAPLSQMAEDDWNRVLEVNLRGAFLCSKAAARQMVHQRDGHIINISSHAARRGPHGQANYAAAKAGMVGLTQSLAKELGPRNVRVNAIFPGVMPTKMTVQLSERQMKDFAEANALGRINSVEEVARFIEYLARTRNISGQVFQLDSRIAPWT